jgi:hypothetical protein
MLIRLAANFAVHAAGGVAVAGLAAVAAEGWRRAYQGQGMDRAPDMGRAAPADGGPGGSGPGAFGMSGTDPRDD